MKNKEPDINPAEGFIKGCAEPVPELENKIKEKADTVMQGYKDTRQD